MDYNIKYISNQTKRFAIKRKERRARNITGKHNCAVRVRVNTILDRNTKFETSAGFVSWKYLEILEKKISPLKYTEQHVNGKSHIRYLKIYIYI